MLFSNSEESFDCESGNSEELFREQAEQECIQSLSKIDLKHERCRNWMAKSYRKLDKLLKESSNKFYLNEDCREFIDDCTTFALNIAPYEYQEHPQLYSKQICDSYSGYKRCEKPRIYKLVPGQTEQQLNPLQTIHENGRFTIRIESEPHSKILVTDQEMHPLQVKRENLLKEQNQSIVMEVPPKNLSIVVVKEENYQIPTMSGLRFKDIPSKLPSKVVRLQIRKSNQTEGGVNYRMGINNEGMIQPEETFDHGVSNSQGSFMHNVLLIDPESRSR